MERLATTAMEKGATNIAFAAYLQLGDSQACVDILSKTGRLPEAALFARSYKPSAVPKVVKEWKKELEGAGKEKVAATIADPEEDSDLFPQGGAESSAGEGSGVMVENEGESQQGYDVDAETEAPKASSGAAEAEAEDIEMNSESSPSAEDEKKGTTEKVKEKVEHAVDKVEDKVEGLVDKVKELAVGGNDGMFSSSLLSLSLRHPISCHRNTDHQVHRLLVAERRREVRVRSRKLG
jgi:coatomer subunit beta'